MDLSGFVDPRHSPGKDMARADRLQALRAAVRTWREHPALGFWYVYDEPSPAVMTPAQLREIHDAVKAETPGIPTAVAQHWCKKWWDYVPCVDIVMPDFYPVRDQTFPNVTRLPTMTEFFGKVGRISGHTMPVVQCFGFPRLPNAVEVRYMLFSPLTQGIQGMAFWSYWYGRYKPFQIRDKDGSRTPGEFDSRYMSTVYSPVLIELKSFVTPVMPADQVDYVQGAEDWTIKDANMLHGLWRRGDSVYVLLVNNQVDSRDVDIPFDCEMDDADLEPLGTTRAVPTRIRDGRLVVTGMTPWEVFTWRCTSSRATSPAGREQPQAAPAPRPETQGLGDRTPEELPEG